MSRTAPTILALASLVALLAPAPAPAGSPDVRLATVAYSPQTGRTERAAARLRDGAAADLRRVVGRRARRPDGRREVPEHRVELRKIFGADDREPVFDTDAYPWSAVAKTFSRFPNGEWVEATAAMVGPYQALTAGHVVYDHDRGGWAESVEVVPGFDLGFEPFGSSFAADLLSFSGWTDFEDFDYDVALLELEDDLGDLTGWLGLASRTRQELLDGLLNTAGYPSDLDAGEGMWFAADFAADVDARSIYLDRYLDAAGGQSGSAVWLKEGDDRLVVGVLSSETDSANVAVRVTDEIFDVLDAWLAGPTALSVEDVGTNLALEVSPGATGAVFVDVRNAGEADVTTTVRVYADPPGGTGPLVGEAAVLVPAGTTVTADVAVTIPMDLTGDHDLVATVNDDQVLDESDYADNTLLGPQLIVVEPWIDLTLGVKERGRLVPGGQAWLRFTVPEGAVKLKVKLNGLRGGFAMIRRPDGSDFQLRAGAFRKKRERFPQAGEWQVVVVNPPISRRTRAWRFKAVVR